MRMEFIEWYIRIESIYLYASEKKSPLFICFNEILYSIKTEWIYGINALQNNKLLQ